MSVGRLRAERVTDPLAQHGEGPVWVSGSRWPEGLYWVDMLAGDVLSLDADGMVSRRNVGSVAAIVRQRRNGGLVYAVERGFALDDGPGTPVRALPELWEDRSVRMNEGGCDPAGNLYCGSMSYSAEPGGGTLYRLDRTGSATEVTTGMTIPNGLEWTTDGSRAFHVDTPTGCIDVLDWDPASGLTNRRPFATLEAGGPDGLTVDTSGGVWVAAWGAGAVYRYAPEGMLSVVVEVPVRNVTACAFGGPDRDELFITTSREQLADPEPTAGALFSVRPGFTGVVPHPYAG